MKRPRLPAALNAGVTLLLLLIVIPLALHAAQSPPPAVAEFAPQVREQVKQAPPGLGFQVGAVAGGPGQPSPSPSPAAATQVPENLVKNCVGDPPRQTEDPQSPPCIAYWQGDNGGSTWRGVTRDTITLVEPTCFSEDGVIRDLVKFFNDRFELYNRQLSYRCIDDTAGQVSEQYQEQIADEANGINPFISAGYVTSGGIYYHHRISCDDHVVSVSSLVALPHYYEAACSPYLWEYEMESDRQFATEGDWICSRLAGQKAVHASGVLPGPPPQDITTMTRRFGVVWQPYYPNDPSSPDPLINAIRACNAAPVITLDQPMSNVSGTTEPDPSTAENAALQLKAKNVTSVVCLCQFYAFGSLQSAASKQGYYPEWVASSYAYNDDNYGFGTGQADDQELMHTFGITFKPRQLWPQDEPAWQAVKEVDPGASLMGSSGEVGHYWMFYRPLLLLASGIQMAGPDLTPQSFARGLWSTTFPNPDTPTHAGHVGFQGGVYSMTQDAAEFWVSDGTPGNSPYSDYSYRAVCYVDRGVRRSLGTFPKGGDPFFKGPCYGTA